MFKEDKMERRIHLKHALQQMQRRDAATGRAASFSFQYAKPDGTLKDYARARLSSIHARGATVNILTGCEGARPHTFRKVLITRFNGKRVYM